ncbi:MAG: sensor histidine kinase [Deltaproteobacteria bacterium]
MPKKSKFSFIGHILIWVIVLSFMGFPFQREVGLFTSLIEVSVDALFYIFIIYFNLFYLFPKYLKGQSLGKYAFYLLVSVILITPVKGMVFFLLNSGDEEGKRDILFNLHYTFLSAFLVAGASTVIKILLEWVIYERDKKKLEKENLQSELKFLKNQINPHFLFNTLNNIYALSLIKSESTPQVILKLSELLRYMLYECNEPKVKLKNEINYIRNYLDLEKLRQKSDVVIELMIEGTIKEQTITPLLFTPFLENAFKHGVNKVLENACVRVNIKIKKNNLLFIIENSKPEFTSGILNKQQGGIGLSNVKKRLELLYKGRYSLEIENTKTYYKIELMLELD